MQIFKIVFDFILIALGVAYISDAGNLMTKMKDLAVNEAHPEQYLSLKDWTKTLTD